MLEVDTGGKVTRELELPIAGALHRAAQPVCTSAGVHVVWEERGPGNPSTLMWSELAGAALGPSTATHGRIAPWASRRPPMARA